MSLDDATPRPPVQTATSRIQRYQFFGLALGALGALGLHLHAVNAPLIHDDYAQRAFALDPQWGRGPFSLYDFVADDNRRALLDRGAIPWWSSPNLTIRFLRPLSSTLTWLDARLFGYDPIGPHIHSLVWWALCSIAVYGLLRRMLSGLAAAIGALAFSVAPAQADPVLWLANREVLVSTAFGAWALAEYVSWRDQRALNAGLRSSVLFSLAFLGGEYALCFAGYVLSLEFTRPKDNLRNRLTGSLPFATPLASYLLAYRFLGYGSRGSGYYRNPFTDFAAFLEEVPRRAATLTATAWVGADDRWLVQQVTATDCLVAGAAIAFIILLLATAASSLGTRVTRISTALLAGSLLSLVPVLASEPSARLLAVPTIGVDAFFGALAAACIEPRVARSGGGRREFAVAGAILLAIIGFVRAPLYALRAHRQYVGAVHGFERRVNGLRDQMRPPVDTAVVLRVNSPPGILWMPFLLRDAAPKRWWALSFQSGSIVAIRSGPRTLEISSADAALFPNGPNDLFRDGSPLHAGDAFTAGGLQCTILETDVNHEARRVRVEFDVDLDDARVQSFSEREAGFEALEAPEVNHGVRLAL